MSCHPHDGPEIWIVLSTHDAGRYLTPQIKSIQNQTYANWRLLLRDDASSDRTAALVADYSQSDPKISCVSDGKAEPMGPSASYSHLIEVALERGANWIALADQDDVWSPTKLEQQVEALLEKSPNPEHSWLLHTDLEVVDEHLGPISDSFLAYAGIRHVEAEPLRTLIIQNFVTGCSCLFSRGLAERAVPVPKEAIMHDWWLSLNAAATGQIDFLSTTTVQYRQHPGNRIGAKKYRKSIASLIGRSVDFRKSDMKEFVAVVEQIRALRDHLRRRRVDASDEPQMSSSLQLIENFLSLFTDSVSRFDRVRGLRRLGISRQDLIRNASLKAKLLLTHFPEQKA